MHVILVEVSTRIDRPVDEVFRYVEDETNISKWDSDLVSATKSSDGPTDVGTTFHLDVKPFMGVTEGDGRVVAYRKDELIELLFDLKKMESHVSHIFKPEADSTTFTRRVEVVPRGFLKVMQPMMKGMIRKRNSEFLAALKKVGRVFLIRS
ncbi:MAG: SRPBCC family protein [Actinobacteria bacterium]|nr:SRPBCC family protein [Actinomycetota bacterium]